MLTTRILNVLLMFGLFVPGLAMAQYGSPDQGQYSILSAQYGTGGRHVDVTNRLRELAQADRSFRMGNSTFGVDRPRREESAAHLCPRAQRPGTHVRIPRREHGRWRSIPWLGTRRLGTWWWVERPLGGTKPRLPRAKPWVRTATQDGSRHAKPPRGSTEPAECEHRQGRPSGKSFGVHQPCDRRNTSRDAICQPALISSSDGSNRLVRKLPPGPAEKAFLAFAGSQARRSKTTTR